jgi:hypothetical protein
LDMERGIGGSRGDARRDVRLKEKEREIKLEQKH